MFRLPLKDLAAYFSRNTLLTRVQITKLSSCHLGRLACAFKPCPLTHEGYIPIVALPSPPFLLTAYPQMGPNTCREFAIVDSSTSGAVNSLAPRAEHMDPSLMLALRL